MYIYTEFVADFTCILYKTVIWCLELVTKEKDASWFKECQQTHILVLKMNFQEKT